MFVPTISENDARKQARNVLKSIVANIDMYDFEGFFKETVYIKDGVYHMVGSEKVFDALKLTQDAMKILAKSIQADMESSDIRNIEVVARKDHVDLRCNKCCYIVTSFFDYARAKNLFDIMKHFKNYPIVFDYAGTETAALGGKYRERGVLIIKYDEGYSIVFTEKGRLGKFNRLEDAQRFLELFAG